jgi:hypothetical protein
MAMLMLAWLSGACVGSPPPAPVVTTAVPTGDALHCADAIDVVSAVPSEFTAVLGVVALPTGRVLQTAPSGQSDPAARLFAKQGLVVRVGAVVDLRIGADRAGHARIAWGNPGKVADHVRVEVSDCLGFGTSSWVAFAGGYYVDEPMCLPIVVGSGAVQEVVRIAVGTACPP